MTGVKLGAGREADVYAWGGNAVVKLYRPGFGGHHAEATALRSLAGLRVAPALLDVVDCESRTGLVLERLGGLDMLTLLHREPWRLLGLARALARTHLAVHAVQAPGDLPDVRLALAARIRDAVLPPRLRDFASRVLDGLPEGDRLCHGDFHPGNVLVTADRVAVVDWAGAARGMPEADHARAILLLRWADPLPGTPPLSRALMATGRSLFAHRYARTYARHARLSSRQAHSWLVAHTAARLSEGIAAEQPILVGLLDRWRGVATS